MSTHIEEVSVKKESMGDEPKLIPPPDESSLQGATLPPFRSVAMPVAKEILDTILPSLYDIDALDTTVGALLSVADLKSLIQQYEFDKMENTLSLILQEHVQHGCNKLRKKDLSCRCYALQEVYGAVLRVVHLANGRKCCDSKRRKRKNNSSRVQVHCSSHSTLWKQKLDNETL